jgi:long-subunit fatty acid transport protein
VGASVSGVYAQIRKFRMPFTMDPSFARGMSGIPQLDPAVYGPLFQQFTEMTAYGDSEDYSGLTWAADAGVAYRNTSGWAVSASWSPRRSIQLDGGAATIDMGAQFQQMMGAMTAARVAAYGESATQAQGAVLGQLAAAGLDLAAGVSGTYEAATDLTLPQTLGVGARVPVRPWWALSAEVEWREWSRAEATMPFRLSGGENPNLNLLVNGDVANGSFTYPFPLEWQDTWSWKVGSELTLPGEYVVRGGYLRGGNPVPVNTVFIAFPAISTQALTLGASARVGGFPLEISYVHALEQAITGCAADHRMGSEYLDSRTTMKQNVFTVGTVVSF